MKTCPQCETGYADSQTTCPTHGLMLNEIRDLRPGLVIHKTYRIVRKLGQGGMGSVYLAEHIHMGEPRALKFLSPDLSRDQKLTSRFLREVRTLRQVHSRHVVECGDLEAAEDDSLFFSMEFVDGPDLRNFLDQASHPIPVPMVLSIVRGIAEGLGAAHAKGMVHRDIKPENVLLASEDNAWIPKIADFGIVATKESSSVYTRTGGTLLTMAYAAPEQWRGTPAAELDGRTDLYALGGVLFEMLTGGTVFEAESYEGWAAAHQRIAPVAPSSRRPDVANWRGLDGLVLRLLAKNREDRPRDVGEVLRLLSAVENLPAARRITVPDNAMTEPGQTPVHKETFPETRPQPGSDLEFSSFKEEEGKRPRNWFPIVFWGIVAAILITVAVTALERRWAVEKEHPELYANPAAQTAPAAQTQPDSPPAEQTAKPAHVDDGMPPARRLTPAEAGQQGEELYNAKRYPEALPLLDQACSGGNAAACNHLGYMYRFHEFGVDQDYRKAAELLEKACDGGSGDGCTGLGELYQSGSGVQRDSAREAAYYSRGCDEGSPRGCYLLGLAYQYGVGVQKDVSRLPALYAKSCQANCASGCLGLGTVYDNGMGVEENQTLAALAFARACDLEPGHGCYYIGLKYRDGKGVEQDGEKARLYFNPACSAGDRRACSLL
jgi:serine/threonine protein kinase